MKEKKLTTTINAVDIQDEGDGVVYFPNGLVITTNKEQLNGTRYDIPSMDLSTFKNKLTVNHYDDIQSIIGRVEGLAKRATDVVIGKIQFALDENPIAHFAYNMLKAGYATDFSIETIGPYPDEDGVYFNSKLVGLSLVVVGNNQDATIERTFRNSLKDAMDAGLEVSDDLQTNGLSLILNNEEGGENIKMFKTIKNTRTFAVTVKYTNAAGEEVETELEAGATVDVSEDQAENVKDQIDEAVNEEAEEEDDEESESDNALTAAVEKLSTRFEQLERNMRKMNVKEPEFKQDREAKKLNSGLAAMDWRERAQKQVNAAWDVLKNNGGSGESSKVLREINEFNLNELVKSGKVSNTITISDFGSFVISPELLTEIEGVRSNFRPLLDRVEFRETRSTQMAWLKRSGDISMTEVEMCDDGADGNLKPVSEYSATINTANLYELAAVTPVCNAATRFLAADLLGDVAQGFRTDYDRKLSQLVIAKLQGAVNSNGNEVTYATTSDVNSVKSFIDTFAEVADKVMGGLFVLSNSSYMQLVKTLVGAGISGPLAGVFTTGEQPAILGRPYVVVPDELMPTLNTAQTKSFTVEGSSVSITEAVFYFDPSTFTGRTSGGLQYDLSTEAAYEVDSTVYSAFQRNELVLRGSFFRGGAVKDSDLVAALKAPGVS